MLSRRALSQLSGPFKRATHTTTSSLFGRPISVIPYIVKEHTISESSRLNLQTSEHFRRTQYAVWPVMPSAPRASSDEVPS